MLRFFQGFAAAVLLAAVGGLVVVYSGAWNVAATADDGPLVDWLLHATMERSVVQHSQAVPKPEVLGQSQVRAGSEEYAAMCAGCHGAPGRMRSAAGKGLRPLPPDLAIAAEEWRPQELFWIVKNGIKMTGMPGFGLTHDDQTIWNIVAFVSALPNMSPDQYREFVMAGSGPGSVHEH